MESSSVSSRLQLHPFPVDRAYFALQAVAVKARALGINILTAIAEQGIEELQGVIELLRHYETTRNDRRPVTGEMSFQSDIDHSPLRDMVRAGVDRVQEIVRDTVCAIVAYFALQGPDPENQRGQLLEPILAQNRALHSVRKRPGWGLAAAR